MFAVLLFLLGATIIGGASMYVILNPEAAQDNTTGSVIELIHERLHPPWNRYFIRGVGMAGLAMSIGFLLMALTILF